MSVRARARATCARSPPSPPPCSMPCRTKIAWRRRRCGRVCAHLLLRVRHRRRLKARDQLLLKTDAPRSSAGALRCAPGARTGSLSFAGEWGAVLARHGGARRAFSCVEVRGTATWPDSTSGSVPEDERNLEARPERSDRKGEARPTTGGRLCGRFGGRALRCNGYNCNGYRTMITKTEDARGHRSEPVSYTL
jgi:hypothetical protein